jgi:hypothetical protein
MPRNATRRTTRPRFGGAVDLHGCGATRCATEARVGAALRSHGRSHRFDPCHAHSAFPQVSRLALTPCRRWGLSRRGGAALGPWLPRRHVDDHTLLNSPPVVYTRGGFHGADLEASVGACFSNVALQQRWRLPDGPDEPDQGGSSRPRHRRRPSGRAGGLVAVLNAMALLCRSQQGRSHWVCVATVAHGQQRSSTVTNGSKEPQVAGLPAHAAGMMQAGDSDCGPEGHRPSR